MRSDAMLAVAIAGVSVVLGGCAHSQTTAGRIEIVPAATEPQFFAMPASTGQGGLFTLGAGDALGQQVHVMDVYLAAIQLIGPPLPEQFAAPRDDAMVWAPDPSPAPVRAELAEAEDWD